jgi:hypothetical protein
MSLYPMCPNCGSTNIATERRMNGNHSCAACRHVWPNMKPTEPAPPTEALVAEGRKLVEYDIDIKQRSAQNARDTQNDGPFVDRDLKRRVAESLDKDAEALCAFLDKAERDANTLATLRQQIEGLARLSVEHYVQRADFGGPAFSTTREKPSANGKYLDRAEVLATLGGA